MAPRFGGAADGTPCDATAPTRQDLNCAPIPTRRVSEGPLIPTRHVSEGPSIPTRRVSLEAPLFGG
jgi:hypothetical protein